MQSDGYYAPDCMYSSGRYESFHVKRRSRGLGKGLEQTRHTCCSFSAPERVTKLPRLLALRRVLDETTDGVSALVLASTFPTSSPPTQRAEVRP